MTHDLAVIIVSTNEARWLTPCLRTLFEHGGRIASTSSWSTTSPPTARASSWSETSRERASSRAPTTASAHANNRGLMTTDARYVLFLNPDTEILDGTFEELVGTWTRAPGSAWWASGR